MRLAFTMKEIGVTPRKSWVYIRVMEWLWFYNERPRSVAAPCWYYDWICNESKCKYTNGVTLYVDSLGLADLKHHHQLYQTCNYKTTNTYICNKFNSSLFHITHTWSRNSEFWPSHWLNTLNMNNSVSKLREWRSQYRKPRYIT